MLKTGKVPSVEASARSVMSSALEFYIGPPRLRDDGEAPPHDTIFKAAELLHEAGAELEKLRAQAAILASRFEQDAASVLADTGATPGGESIAESVADYLVVPFSQDVRAAAGSGETVFSETTEFRIALESVSKVMRLGPICGQGA